MLVNIRDTQLGIEVLGPSDARHTVIVHHGAPGVSSRHDSRAEYGFLSDKYRVVVYDARGSGDSGTNGPFTNENWVADLEAVRAWLGVQRFFLAGSSYGGIIAMEYATAHEERLLGLLLRGTAADGEHIITCIDRALDSPRNTVDRGTWERYLSGGLRSDDDLRDAWRRLVPLYTHGEPPSVNSGDAGLHHATQNAAMMNMPDYDVRSRLPEILCPTLVLVGRHDWITPPEYSRQITDLIPRAEMVVFENSGHSPHGEEPMAFESEVRAFLDRAGTMKDR